MLTESVYTENLVSLHEQADLITFKAQIKQSELDQPEVSPGPPSSVARESLHGSGFDIDLAQKTAFKDYRQLRHNQSHQQAIEVVLTRLADDIRTFYIEYLKQAPLLANPIDFIEVDGQRRVGASGQTLVKVTSPDERLGAPHQAIKDRLEPFLLKAQSQPGSVAAIISPLGPSGYKEDYRRRYLKSQIYAYEITLSGELRAATFVLENFDNFSSRELLKTLGAAPSIRDCLLDRIGWKGELGEVSRLSRRVATLRPNGRLQYSLEDVFTNIKKVAKDPNSFQFLEIGRQLSRTDQLLEIGANYETFIADFQNYVRGREDLDDEASWQQVGDKLAEQILRISLAFRGGQTGFEEAKTMSNADFKAEGSVVADLPGCNGGGGSSRGGGWNKSETNPGCVEIQCRRCGWKPSADQLSQVGVTILACPGKSGFKCGWRPGESV